MATDRRSPKHAYSSCFLAAAGIFRDTYRTEVPLAILNPTLNIIVPTRNSQRYIDLVLGFYLANGVDVTVFVDTGSKDATLDIARRHGRVVPISNTGTRVGTMIEEMSRTLSGWVLRIDDDELPTLAMLDFARRAVLTDDADVYGFFRHQCLVTPDGRLVRHVAYTHRQWRLYHSGRVDYVTRGHSPGFERDKVRCLMAPSEACMIHLDWAVHSYEERREKVARYDAHTPGHGTTWRSYYLHEEAPLSARDLAPLDFPEFVDIASQLSERMSELCRDIAPAGSGHDLAPRGAHPPS